MQQNTKRHIGLTARLKARLREGLRDERGATAVFFAIGLLLLAPATLGLVDVYLTSTQRSQLQDALDAATLYAARSDANTDAAIQIIGEGALKANLNLPDDQMSTLVSTFTLDENKIRVIAEAKIKPPSIAPKFLTLNGDSLTADSEVVRNSNNVEVAIVLDTTGSMQNSMADLRSAATDLVKLVVKDSQQPYYSKAALVPYSVGVNVGTYADAVRGAVRGPTNITGATKASQVVVTSNGHGLSNGERVKIAGVKGMTSINGTFIADQVATNTFKLKNLDGSVLSTSSSSSYTSGGTATCVAHGCASQNFTNLSGNNVELPSSKCVTERTGTQAYTDAAPSVAKVGWHYNNTTASDGACNSAAIIPLTATKKTLTDQIATLKDDGSTAGHIGLAWGWYMISPEWNTVWTGASAPASYTQPQTIKVVVLMTDGAFNTAYCKGVNAKDSGFGQNSDRINCNADNGQAFAQAKSLCANMKAKKVQVYTVGFNIGSDKTIKDFLNTCATDAAHVYLPSSGTALKDAFRAIGQDINSLRIAK